MPDVKLKFESGERILGTELVTIGRTPDNDISFPDDPNVSRHHAEIEYRGGEYCLIDLNSSNGTTLNGNSVRGEAYLGDSDTIVLGGSSKIEVSFLREEESESEKSSGSEGEAADSAPSAPTGSMPSGSAEPSGAVASSAAIPAAEGSGSGNMLLIAGAICGVALVFVAIAAVVYFVSASSCDARAEILSPEPGDTIINPTEVEVSVTNGGCVARAVFTIDGIEFASADESPFSTTIDPKEFPDLADGFDHGLTVVLEDEEGNRIEPTGAVQLAFETRAVTKPTPEGTTTTEPGRETASKEPAKRQISLVEINEMSKNLLKQFSSKTPYNVSNRQFLQAIQKMTEEYAVEGFSQRAAQYRDVINVAYVREQNLDAPLGFILAMSRSKFNPVSERGAEGLWRMTNEFVTANAYNGLCGSERLGDASQNCAAKASALYMKAVVFGVFDGDAIYGAAVFGKSPQDAGAWKATLPANRSDIWNTIKTPQEREQIVRFFAAGIVADNPQKFGLANDRPLSELYRLAM